jgi:biotin transport system substrate-specific component
MAIGEVVLLTIGTIWLANDLNVSAAKAIDFGVTPFLAGDLVKLAVAALAFPVVWRLARR